MSDLVSDILFPKTNLKLKVGLYFGSFNPVHIGHMAIANYMVEYTDLDQLWFVVSPQNPLKNKSNLLSDYHRLQLVNQAIEDDNRFRASNIEFDLPQPSYTIDTLAYLSDKYPDYKFIILMGSDNLESLHRWKNFKTIIENYGIVVYPRPGHELNKVLKHKNIVIAKDAPLMEISASFIRKAIKTGRDIRHYLPQNVWKYIEEMNFYKK